MGWKNVQYDTVQVSRDKYTLFAFCSVVVLTVQDTVHSPVQYVWCHEGFSEKVSNNVEELTLLYSTVHVSYNAGLPIRLLFEH